MRVEVIQARAPMGHKCIGDVIPEMPEGQANDLIRRGIVRRLDAPVNRMMVADTRGYQAKKRR